MVSAVGSTPPAAASPVASAGGTRTPATGTRTSSLDAELNTARAQLEDWVTCPSAKTPEGKAKIKEVTAKFDSIKAQIAKEAKTADLQQTRQKPAVADPSAAGATAAAPSARAIQNRPNLAIGGNIDVYA